MKTFLLSVFILTVWFYQWKSDLIQIGSSDTSKFNSNRYNVYKIDSINNYYLIYARKNDKLYKIVSIKNNDTKCCRIKVNKNYKFKLHSMLSVNGKSIIPLNSINEISGWRIDENTTVKFEGDSIRDLYNAENIKGLCFIKD